MTAAIPAAELDARFSDPNASATPWERVEHTIDGAELFWISTVRSTRVAGAMASSATMARTSRPDPRRSATTAPTDRSGCCGRRLRLLHEADRPR